MIKDPQTKYRTFAPIALQDRQWPNKTITKAPRFLSSDLRDGNQALIEPMSIEKKLRMFDLLVECGFKEIEIAFPSASDTEFNFVRRLIEEKRVPEDVTLQVLTQAREDLIVRTFEALKGCKQAIVHVYNATSPVFRKVVFNMEKEQIKALAVKGATLIKNEAKKYPETNWTFQYSPEIFSDTELDFSIEVCEAVCDVWEPTPEHKVILNLPATVEMSTPNVYADQIEYFCRHIKKRDSVVISIHVHNDRGCAVAATELALMAGGDRVEGCLFGHGERTGNVDLITIALNLYTQGIDPTLDFTRINKIVREVEHCTQLPVHPRHPYAGELVFTAFSGSHQDAIRKGLSQRKKDVETNPNAYWEVPYLPIDPMDLDRSYEAVIRVNSQSGKGGVAYLLEQDHGIEMPRRLQIEFSRVAQRVADETGKELTSDVLYSIFEEEYFNAPRHIDIEKQKMLSEDDEGNTTIAVVFVRNGKQIQIEAKGNGPIAAFVAAINQAFSIEIDVVDYNEHARSQGAQASAVSYIEMQIGNRTLFGAGTHANSSKSSYFAIMSALNRAIEKQWLTLS
ncbi:2-isopropylmalate synthase [Thorsellia anophelis]|uniref:2-isopropylmalate synthase n=1 Tax=Thorsellia anophelis DSM 18579 TaxID=1123402 RepID=A0A1I0FIY3_9GAMM|nr:2-isopropylmalate synthase [Thorsellia anophelis]SET57959.1 2-isopropylmalate synthase [Thorsellia anophelis DSM 18579]